MKNNQQDNLLVNLFTEEAAQTFGYSQRDGFAIEHKAELTFVKASELPILPQADLASDEELRTYWRTLRTFFRSGQGGNLPMDAKGANCYPVLLLSYRNKPIFQRNFPLWLEETEGGQTMPFHDLLTECIARFAPAENEAKILKDNLLRLEVIVQEKVKFAEDAYQVFAVIDDAIATLKQLLNIDGKDGETFDNDLANLRKHIPRQGLLIPFSPNVPFYLLAVITRVHLTDRRKKLTEKIQGLLAKLKDILAVEKEKSPEAHSPEKLHGSLDFAESFFNFEELSSVMPTGGSSVMPEERLHRIEKIVSVLENSEAGFFQKNAYLILNEELAETAKVDWKHAFAKSDILVAPAGQECHLARQVFDENMAAYANIFAAIRTAELEVDNRYFPEIHSDYFAHFDWRSFTSEELSVCPPVLYFTKDNSLIENELKEFSELLSSNRPIKMLVAKQGVQKAAEGFSFRQEIGAMAIAHRNTYVLQSASIAASKLVDGFREGLSNQTPALFYIFSPTAKEQTLSVPSLWASAAVEGREFPGFVYNSQKSTRWGSRFDILHNPQPEKDWPKHKFVFQTGNGEEQSIDLSFTFADFAAQDAHYADQFHLVPSEFWTDDLVPLGNYLQQTAQELYAKVPYIWVVDEKNILQKAAVSWPLVLTCQERLDFWHFLQENAGVHSIHVEQATERLRQEMVTATNQQMAELEAAHAADLKQAKEEEGRVAMERLAAVLLDLDISEFVSAPTVPTIKTKSATPKPVKPSTEIETQKPEASKQEEEEILSLDEPWIDSPLCTSCNDCINLNKRMFSYNENKQAYIADPKAGTFRELVLAAEKCPVSIIHPGAPMNPNEPELEDLIKRAEPFN